MQPRTLSLHLMNLAACALIAGAAVAALSPDPAPPPLLAAPEGPARAIPDARAIPAPPIRSARPAPRPDVLCLALNAVHEALGEGERGMAAVTRVVLNRAAVGYKGQTTICGTVYARAQFSWTHEDPAPADPVELARAKRIVQGVLEGRYLDRVPGALHYYNPDKVAAWWAPSYTEVAVIGNHRFMK